MGGRLAQAGAAHRGADAVPARGGGGEPGQRVCDIGCGGRRADHRAGRRRWVRRGGWSGSTFRRRWLSWHGSGPREAGATNVEFVVADVQTEGLGPEPFDLAASQLGVMFFDEPLAAFGAIRAGLRAGGRLVFACWQCVEKNPWHTGTALRPFVPPPRLPAPGKSPVGPFSLGDDEYVRDILGGAGFGAVGAAPRDHGAGAANVELC